MLTFPFGGPEIGQNLIHIFGQTENACMVGCNVFILMLMGVEGGGWYRSNRKMNKILTYRVNNFLTF